MWRILLWLRQLKKRHSPYVSAINVFISRENLLHNLHEYQTENPDLAFAPVLKSNAYGHGLVDVARILEKENTAFYVVDSLFEAYILCRAGIYKNILVIGYVNPDNIRKCFYKNTSFAITSLSQLTVLSKTLALRHSFHLKIDTGMHRHGILPTELDEAIELLKQNKNIVLEGVCSHFADADSDNETFTQDQINVWKNAVEKLTREFPEIKHFHIAATAGTVYAREKLGNVARLGIGLYGIAPSEKTTLPLKPALSMHSEITSIRTLEKGEMVGYGQTFTVAEKMTVATIPAGYFEGIDRRLSNIGFVQVHGELCPIVGRTSMNITSVDVTALTDVKLGDDVVIISPHTEDKNSVVNMARLATTIPYEILVHIPQHLKRTVV
jgi:alanine racemase